MANVDDLNTRQICSSDSTAFENVLKLATKHLKAYNRLAITRYAFGACDFIFLENKVSNKNYGSIQSR